MEQISADDIVGCSTNARDASHDDCQHEPTPKTPSETRPLVDETDVPKTGMVFNSLDDAKLYYRQYARRVGFETLTRSTKTTPEGKCHYAILACSRNGSPQSKPDTGKLRRSKKIKCPAKISVKLDNNGLWTITDLVRLSHIHELSPNKSRLFPENRTITMQVKRTINMNDEAGVRANKTYRALVLDSGGSENVSFIERDLRNYVAKERRLLGKDGDGQALLGYFARMQKQNNNFYYDIDVDNEFHIKNVFWADARTRAAYESFGDVVTFDTTYLTNKYDMSFAPFVGVNHHGQSTLLGCGLLSNEDTESFVWLFQSFLRCMCGKAPVGIVTDQCRAMKNAIEIVFPNTRQRWCLWHIMKKIPEKLSRCDRYNEIKHDLKVAVYDSFTIDEFETKWATLMENYGLHDNAWLNGLFEERTRWVPIYLKPYFWAGMSTTQRSESINAFFDGYINLKTSLSQFVRQYDNALHDKAEKEYQADYRSYHTVIKCNSGSMIERQYQQHYTHAKFAEVQHEFRGKMNCCVLNVDVEGSVSVYSIKEESIVYESPRDVVHKVSFNRQKDVEMHCSCLLFEFRGIICRHSLVVLQQEDIRKAPSKYLLSRWSKLTRRKHTYIRSSYDVKELEPQMQRYDRLCKAFFKRAEEAAVSEATTKQLEDAIEFEGATIKAFFQSSKQADSSPYCKPHVSSHDDQGQSNEVQQHLTPIQSPKKVTRKGRPREKRKMSTIEQLIKKKNKTSTGCHDSSTVDENTNTSISQPQRNTLIMESSYKIATTDASGRTPLASNSHDATKAFHIFEDDNWVTDLSQSQSQGNGFTALLAAFDNDMTGMTKEPALQITSHSLYSATRYEDFDYTGLRPN